ncbi:sensor domain-containing diguanylate cyclase [Tepidimonas sp.]|uniref:sensor domain-containing diguanylate cyclase n=1 Tax=Tepidimonas sp. TaxID=2002775 RepID=UPI002FDFFA66
MDNPAPHAPPPVQPLWRVWAAGVAVAFTLGVLALWGVDRATRWWALTALTREFDTERARSQTLASATATVLTQRLALAHGVAVSFSQGGEVRALLHALAQRPTPPPPATAERLRQLDARLDIGVRELGLGLIAVADHEGVVVAAGEPPGVRSFVGNRYRDGPLYAAAREGRSARMFMVGETTGRRSVVFAEPVMVDGRFVGYVGASITLDEGVPPAEANNAIVSDAHGVVVLSREQRWLFRRLVHVPTWPPPPAEGWPIYGVQPPRLWAWQPGPQPDIWWLGPANEGTPVLETRSDVFDGLLHVHVLQPARWMEKVEHQRRLLFGLGAALAIAVLTVMVLLVTALWQARRHRIALAAMNRELQRLVITDALTGIANRRRLLELLDDELRRMRRQGRPLTVLSLDLDHFKQVNDTYGHAIGDAVLQHVVHKVQQQLRATDHFGRIGGEEFAVLLPDTGFEAAQKVAWKLREAVAQAPLQHPDGPTLHVTLSVGGATSADPASTAASLLAQADAALYAAKAAGRDRVRWANGSDLICPPAD